MGLIGKLVDRAYELFDICDFSWCQTADFSSMEQAYAGSVASVPNPQNTRDDLLNAAIEYAEGAVKIAEELLYKWYEAERDRLPRPTARGYTPGLARLDEEYKNYKHRLERLKK